MEQMSRNIKISVKLCHSLFYATRGQKTQWEEFEFLVGSYSPSDGQLSISCIMNLLIQHTKLQWTAREWLIHLIIHNIFSVEELRIELFNQGIASNNINLRQPSRKKSTYACIHQPAFVDLTQDIINSNVGEVFLNTKELNGLNRLLSFPFSLFPI